jgi:DNA repair exonuclease SbcCD nuclease subunit
MLNTESNSENSNTTNYEIIKKSKKNINKIAHLSDIHISKNTKNHENYRKVFKRLYNSLYKQFENTDNNLIVITGDIIHENSDISIPQVELVKEFFINLSNICPVCYILGNHDTYHTEDKSRNMNAIVKNLESVHNIYLLDKDCVYEYYNILFCVTTQFAKELTLYENHTDKIRIGLYHGSMYNKFLRVENDTNNFTFKEEEFENAYDWAMLGDQHDRRFFSNKKIFYSGSLIQQHKREHYEKGYIVLDLDKKKPYEVNVKNDKCIFVVENDNDIKNIPINYDNMEIYFGSNVDRKKIEVVKTNLNKKCNILKINTDRKWDTENIDLFIDIDGKKIDYKNLTCRQLKEFLYFGIAKNRVLNNEEDNMLWRIICDECNIFYDRKNFMDKKFDILWMKFDNVGIYGENNMIDFVKKEGLIFGSNGANGDGKSTCF